MELGLISSDKGFGLGPGYYANIKAITNVVKRVHIYCLHIFCVIPLLHNALLSTYLAVKLYKLEPLEEHFKNQCAAATDSVFYSWWIIQHMCTVVTVICGDWSLIMQDGAPVGTFLNDFPFHAELPLWYQVLWEYQVQELS